MLRKVQEKEILRVFGKDKLRPAQKELIQLALAGKNALGILPTGYGKSLCYQAAAYLLGGTTVVVSPLLALMRQQVDNLRTAGIPACRFDSTLTAEQKICLTKEICTGRIRLLYVAPESLENEQLNAALDKAELTLFAVDEAHCISQWGHSFRPDYLTLPDTAKKRSFRCTLAFTATATPRVRDDLCAAFDIPQENVVAVSPHRANILRRVQQCEDAEHALCTYLSTPARRPAILYTRTRRRSEELAAHLVQHGFRAAYYHAGLPADLREQLQDSFLHNTGPDVLVATIAFGMGIDKPDVRAVVHVNLPGSPEAYLQESGRAGRDGLPAESLVLICGEDYVEAENRIYAAEPDTEGILRCMRCLLPAEQSVVSLWELETQCDVAEEVLRRALSYLVQRGAVRIVCRGFKAYKVRPLFPAADILSGRDVAESAQLRWLLEHREAEVEEAACAWQCSYHEALNRLTDCEASGEWKLTRRKVALCLAAGETPLSAAEAAKSLCAFYADRRKQDLARLHLLEDLLCSESCLNSALEQYFTGSSLPQTCGHCPACCGEIAAPPPLPAPQIPPPGDMPNLARPNQRRRFLAGISSPMLLAQRLYAHPLYGTCRTTPWEKL